MIIATSIGYISTWLVVALVVATGFVLAGGEG